MAWRRRKFNARQKNIAGADAIVLFVNCLTLGLLVMALTLTRYPLFSPGSMIIGVICAVAGWCPQKLWIRFKLGRADKRHTNDIRFPEEVAVELAPPRRREKK